jgi:hypothetical protein
VTDTIEPTPPSIKQCCRCQNAQATKTITLNGNEPVPGKEKRKPKSRVVFYKLPVCTRCYNILQIPRWVASVFFLGGLLLQVILVLAGLEPFLPLLIIVGIGIVAWILFDQNIIDPMPAKIRAGKIEYIKK